MERYLELNVKSGTDYGFVRSGTVIMDSKAWVEA